MDNDDDDDDDEIEASLRVCSDYDYRSEPKLQMKCDARD